MQRRAHSEHALKNACAPKRLIAVAFVAVVIVVAAVVVCTVGQLTKKKFRCVALQRFNVAF